MRVLTHVKVPMLMIWKNTHPEEPVPEPACERFQPDPQPLRRQRADFPKARFRSIPEPEMDHHGGNARHLLCDAVDQMGPGA